jgi:hypothetical protein
MAVRSNSRMNDGALSMKNFLHSPPGRMALVLLVVGVTAGLLPLIFLVNLANGPTIPPAWLKWTGVACLGLVAGLSARRLFGDLSFVVQMSAALLALLSGLWLAGWLTQGYLGLPGSLPQDDWMDGLGQVTVGCLAAWLALRAWGATSPASSVQGAPDRLTRKLAEPFEALSRKRSVKRPPASSQKRPPQKKDLPLAARPQFWKSKWTQWRGQAQAQSRRWAKGLQASRQAAQARFRAWLAPRPPRPKIQVHERPVKVSAARQPGDSSVRLVGEMEHRCPYCLEPVEKSDPRGVKVCSICHTRHHADCWAVTGMCQVPHHYE